MNEIVKDLLESWPYTSRQPVHDKVMIVTSLSTQAMTSIIHVPAAVKVMCVSTVFGITYTELIPISIVVL